MWSSSVKKNPACERGSISADRAEQPVAVRQPDGCFAGRQEP